MLLGEARVVELGEDGDGPAVLLEFQVEGDEWAAADLTAALAYRLAEMDSVPHPEVAVSFVPMK